MPHYVRLAWCYTRVSIQPVSNNCVHNAIHTLPQHNAMMQSKESDYCNVTEAKIKVVSYNRIACCTKKIASQGI